MAHSPVSRPDPFEPLEPHGSVEADATEEPAAGKSISEYLKTLVASGGGTLSADVALDLVLNEIVGRACLATGATGAAIALAREGEMVCRATTGENAPDIGTRLASSHGLSGACVRTGEWQRCDDPESDPRVDVEACRRLGVHSILVVPLAKADELIGVIEIFSIRPTAFGDREGRILQAFSREILENVEFAAGLQTAKPEPCVTDSASLLSSASAIAEPDVGSPERELPPGDFWTTTLLVCVILLALILGWLVGRAGWRRATINSASRARQPVQSQPVAPPVDSSMIAPTEPPTRRERAGRAVSSSSTADDSAPDDGLVVSRNGEVIFRTSPQRNENFTTPANLPTSSMDASRTPGLRISPEIAQEYLAKRVEPEYPEQARKPGVQGPVVLDAWVGKDGRVQRLVAISGDPQLLTAATQAVAQWRFRPFFHGGQPAEFATRITVVFRSP